MDKSRDVRTNFILVQIPDSEYRTHGPHQGMLVQNFGQMTHQTVTTENIGPITDWRSGCP